MVRIPRTLLLSELRSAGFRFVPGKQRRTDSYRKRGGDTLIAVPTTKLIPEQVARSILDRAKRSRADVDIRAEICAEIAIRPDADIRAEIDAFIEAWGQEGP